MSSTKGMSKVKKAMKVILIIILIIAVLEKCEIIPE